MAQQMTPSFVGLGSRIGERDWGVSRVCDSHTTWSDSSPFATGANEGKSKWAISILHPLPSISTCKSTKFAALLGSRITSQNETRQLPLLIVFYCQVSCEVVSFLYTFKRKTTCYKAVIYSSTVVCITCASQLSKTQICFLTFYYVTTDKNGHLS